MAMSQIPKDCVITLLKKLIRRASITPNDKGCQDILLSYLIPHHFKHEKIPFSAVDNLWSWHGSGKPIFVFAGHTDVVPVGDKGDWFSPPFQPTIKKDGYLYGRGASDMKGSLSAMVIAAINFVQQYPKHRGTLAFLITSDEEGAATDGTQKALAHLKKKRLYPDYCVLGEPSSEHLVGDTLKIGRRGSLYGELTVFGKAGHIAYPHLAKNPIEKSLAALSQLVNHPWDQGDGVFPPTTFQYYKIHADAKASNVIPATLHVAFNFRYNPSQTPAALKKIVHEILKKQKLVFQIKWHLSAKPFVSQGHLTRICENAVQSICHRKPTLSTSGGTSDGRFIADTGCEVVELGPTNRTIHQANERIKLTELITLVKLYRYIVQTILT